MSETQEILGRQKSARDDEEFESIAASKSIRLYNTMTERRNVAKTYNVEKMATMRVFSVWYGSVFENNTLWKETGVVAIVYLCVFITGIVFRDKRFQEFIGKESQIRAFLSMFSALIGLLLSFYTALNLSRWWEMRMAAWEIEDGCAKLTMLLSQGVTRDEEALFAVHRYARASLLLIFKASQAKEDDAASAAFTSFSNSSTSGRTDPLIEMEKSGLLIEDEAAQLRVANSDSAFIQAGILWTWLANLCYRLNEQGRLAGPPHLCCLLEACNRGRAGVSKIQTLLETPIPMGYVHLLCLMVKLHNLILAILYSLISVMHAGGDIDGWDHIGLFRTCFRAFFMPLMYNAILILNLEIQDPFGQDSSDFKFEAFDSDMEQQAISCMRAAENMPAWMGGKKKYEPYTV